ncbi:MAG: TerB family tellurite resistance protein [Bacteroidetes bacterium]|nr:TerB family tellurite resistance protein [Bacteroidota bacterium]
MVYTKNFYSGMGSLIYALVCADGKIDSAEVEQVAQSLLKEFGDRDMSSKGSTTFAELSRLQQLKADSETAYSEAMEAFAKVPTEYAHARPKLLNILEKVSLADKVLSQDERNLIHRFRQDSAALN